MNIRAVILLSLLSVLFAFVGFKPIADPKMVTYRTDPINSVIRIAAVGDIMMGSTYPIPILPPNHGADLFKLISDELIDSEITIGNLEGPLCDSGKPKKDSTKYRFIFATPTRYVKNLVAVGFDVLNLANNHIGDFDTFGINTTKRVLDQVGIKYTGLKNSYADLIIKNKKVFVVGFSPYRRTNNLLDTHRAQKLIADLKRQGAIVIVTFHSGNEGVKHLHTKDSFEYFLDEPRGNVIKFAHSVIDSGADLVIGHGPHVPRALEIYKNKLIAYSLGNFCTYGRFCLKKEQGLSLILKVDLDTLGNFVSGRIVPLYQEPPGIPKPDSLGRTIELIRKLSLSDFPLSAPNIDSTGFITIQASIPPQLSPKYL
ncbi:MAG: CapA family protein [candidate division WOR-3 bacterium]